VDPRLLLIALAPRLIYLLHLESENAARACNGCPTTLADAYLTKNRVEHGLRFGTQGVEYFWGSLHPIVLVILFFVTVRLTSCSKAPESCLRIAQRGADFPSMPAVLNLSLRLPRRRLLRSRHRVFNDASGMLEPMGVSCHSRNLAAAKRSSERDAWGLAPRPDRRLVSSPACPSVFSAACDTPPMGNRCFSGL